MTHLNNELKRDSRLGVEVSGAGGGGGLVGGWGGGGGDCGRGTPADRFYSALRMDTESLHLTDGAGC